ncbi:hypothetical protein F442_04593 [Phytophthora nicotianae P10297]|uniref:SWIM-type domain-containing protein n=1 Tax=Phytophthora nicotianae P10297 TaxID=1317064 RepID=W2ZSG4_PHYNI|nr:hypothetical protein F442_04593 [Phytophthora nicotianae P10297]
MQHWDTTTDKWVMFKRGGVPHLMNNTNNRLESKWGRINEVMDTHMTIDELISILTTLQGYAEERYLSEWHRVGSRVQINEDRELKSIGHLSTYAFRIVSVQYKLAVGPQANYSVDMDCEKTRLTNPATGKAHEVDPRGVLIQLATCDCIFSQTCLLPCRHVMYDRSKANFETVISPLHTFSSRWIVQSPSNNIDDGAVVLGGLNRVSCPPIRVLPPVDRDTKYCPSKQITDKINDVMSIQPSTTYRLAMPWVEGFHTARHAGKLKEFQGRGLIPSPAGLPSLSQISVSDSVTISLLSFAERSADALLEDKGPSSVVHDTIRVKKTAEATRDLPTASLKALSAEDGKGSASSAVQGSAAAPIAFGSPPKRKGLSKRALKNKNLGRR